jgi:hypothetical protein
MQTIVKMKSFRNSKVAVQRNHQSEKDSQAREGAMLHKGEEIMQKVLLTSMGIYIVPHPTSMIIFQDHQAHIIVNRGLRSKIICIQTRDHKHNWLNIVAPQTIKCQWADQEQIEISSKMIRQ